jgi:hypothetical protein
VVLAYRQLHERLLTSPTVVHIEFYTSFHRDLIVCRDLASAKFGFSKLSRSRYDQVADIANAQKYGSHREENRRHLLVADIANQNDPMGTRL